MNASQAMPNGGRLTIKAENVILSPAELPVESNNDHFIKITLTDQGVGISPEHLNKIFDPYFTTKRTGSGLATVFSIIKNHISWTLFPESFRKFSPARLIKLFYFCQLKQRLV